MSNTALSGQQFGSAANPAAPGHGGRLGNATPPPGYWEFEQLEMEP